MSHRSTKERAQMRTWLSGLAVTLTTIIAYLAFWRLAPVVTFIIGVLALIGLVISAWVLGAPEKPTRPQAKSPSRRADRDA